MTKLEERRFVIFDAAQIDVNDIKALAYQTQMTKGVDADGKPVAVRNKVAVIMLGEGSSITLDGESLKKFEHWWKHNVEAERVELPVAAPSPAAPVASPSPVVVPASDVPPKPPSAPAAPVPAIPVVENAVETKKKV